MKNVTLKIWFFSVLSCLLLVTSAHAATVYQKAAGIYPVSWSEELSLTGFFNKKKSVGTGQLTFKSNKTWTYKETGGTISGTYQIKGNKFIIAKTKVFQNMVTDGILDRVRAYGIQNPSATIERFTITSPALRSGKPKGTTVIVNVEGLGRGTYQGQKGSAKFKYQQIINIK